MTNGGFDSVEALEIFGDLLPKIGRQVLKIREEGKLDPVNKKAGVKDLRTAADMVSQARLHECVWRHWPSYGIHGEEDLRVHSDSGYEWLFDPVDATNRFALGFDLFSISAGLTINGVPEFGVFYFPTNNIFVNAARGRGTFVNRERVILPQNNDGLENEIFVSLDLVRDPKQLERVRSFGCHIMEIHSFTGTVLLILEGKVGAYVHGGATPFDLGASALAAKEAGCTVSQLDGGAIDFSKEKIPVVIARNREIHKEMRRICA